MDMAQSFQVAPEYVDEITFTTKVSSIEYRVSNQIQVSINIVGIRYRTSTNVEEAKGPCGLEKACQSCCPNGLNRDDIQVFAMKVVI